MSTGYANAVLAQGGFEIQPAYGRDYKSKKEVMDAWNTNKDFVITFTGQTISRSCAEQYGLKGKTLYARYKKMREVLPIKV